MYNKPAVSLLVIVCGVRVTSPTLR